MAEYIEREALINKIQKRYRPNRILLAAYLVGLINEQPAADVQEVVRCKDCIFGKYDDDLNMILCKRIYNLSDGECVYNNLNDFCSYGAKMDKERN